MKSLKGETMQKKIIEALETRIENAPNENQRDTIRAEKAQFEKKSALAALVAMQELELDIAALANKIAIADKSNSDFIAVYALQKIRKSIFAIAQKSVSAFDKYTNSIIKNLASLQSLDNLNAQRSICSKIELDEMQQAQAVRVYHNCSPSTASTQASSTRMMLHHLNICNVRKGAKGDSISFADTKIAEVVKELYA